MAVALSITIDTREFDRTLEALNLTRGKGQDALDRALDTMGFKVQANAATKQIRRGGSGPPHPTRLTSRTGTGRRSIRVNRRALARIIGSDIIYMRVHELGGTRHPPRPYLSPALAAEAPQFDDILAKELQRLIDRA